MANDTQLTPHTGVHRVSRRFLEPAQDILVLARGVALFGLMARSLAGLIRELLEPNIDFRAVIAEVLFVLVMVELVRLLVIYLEEHRVAVDFMVELGIVATLREIVLRGVVEIPWEQIAAISIFLLALVVILRFGDLRCSGNPGGDEPPLTRNKTSQDVEVDESGFHSLPRAG
jgi:uncharacterized membrane protein (DUF373 family)